MQRKPKHITVFNPDHYTVLCGVGFRIRPEAFNSPIISIFCLRDFCCRNDFQIAMSSRKCPKIRHLFLEQLLAVLVSKETALLANYPNPFNPETWIPYQLVKFADVTISIYTANGQVVRRLTLGHQPVGMYQNHSRAAYWDGRNAFGELVASGLYFYMFTVGDFTSTWKMLIRE